MAKIIEPPILLSRMLTFVLSASVVVLATMVFTLFKMVPLERPEVFFVLTPTRSTNVIIEPLNTDSGNDIAIQRYINGFIREYVTARNTLDTNASITKNNWVKVVKPWSGSKIYSDFTNTVLYKEYAKNQMLPVSCSVNFLNSTKERAIIQTGDNMYLVNFMWVCKNIGGQTTQKNYKIQIRIQSDLDTKTSGVFDILEKISNNPLGIQVTQYTVLDNKGDPLNSDVTSW